MNERKKGPLLTRKTFLQVTPLKVMGLTLAVPLLASSRRFVAGKSGPQTTEGASAGTIPGMSVGQIMDLVKKHAAAGNRTNTVDTLKSGRETQQVTGVVTCMFATIDIIEKAKVLGANFIIAHEPTFYNHADDVSWVKPNQVVSKKVALLEKYGIAVWRCHDYIHAFSPDGITYGVARQAGWLDWYKGNPMLSIPTLTLGELALHLKKSLQIQSIRMIGNAESSCSRIALLPGAWGGQKQMSITEKESPDVLIVGEVHEWETAEYIRDGLELGEKTALIVLGHSPSEEPGMAWMADWLKPQLGELRITHISSNSPFQWV